VVFSDRKPEKQKKTCWAKPPPPIEPPHVSVAGAIFFPSLAFIYSDDFREKPVCFAP
jgi:hypothetical protein